MVQVPAPMKLTVFPAIEQMALALPSIENTTGLPEPPPLADTR